MSIVPDEWLAFQVLSEELNFGRAALRLHISQPALTKQIRRLEAKLDGQLFVRTTSHVRLTPAGKALLEPVRRFLSSEQYLTRLAHQAVQGEAGLLRVGFGIAVLPELLPRVVKRFRKLYPQAMLEMRDMASGRQIEALLNETIDIGFTRFPVGDPLLAERPMIQERLLLAVNSRDAQTFAGGLGSCSEAPFVVVARRISSTLYDHITRLCQAAGFTPRIALEVSDLFTVLSLVRSGLGVGLVPSSARRMRIPDVRYIDTKNPEASWKIGLVHRVNDHSLLRKRFEECVVEEAAQLNL